MFEGDTGKDIEEKNRLYLLPPEMWAFSVQNIGVHWTLEQPMEGGIEIGSLCLKGPGFVSPNKNKSKGQQCVRTATK